MKHALVTGGAGFIGSYLVDKLIKLNVKVTIVDKLFGYGAIPYVHPKRLSLMRIFVISLCIQS